MIVRHIVDCKKGHQVPHSLDTQISQEGAVWPAQKIFGGSPEGFGTAKRE